MRGLKTGGRKKGTKNKAIRDADRKYLPREVAIKIAKLDQTGGKSMAEIQLTMARMVQKYTDLEEKLGNKDVAVRYAAVAAKIAHDLSPFLYASQQSIKHSGDEDGPAIRIETLSDWQLQKLIERLRKD
jgi:hypothetical protein